MISLKINSHRIEPVDPGTEVPNKFLHLLFRGADVAYGCGEFGEILLQQINLNGITILYNTLHARKDLPVDFYLDPGSIHIYAALKSTTHYKIDGLPEWRMEEGKFNILNTPGNKGTLFAEEGQQYQCIHILYSLDHANQLLSLFPQFQKWLAQDDAGSWIFFSVNPSLTPELKEIKTKILNCGRLKYMHKYYLETMARQFLFVALITANRKSSPGNGLLKQYSKSIQSAKRFLDDNLGQSLSIDILASQTGLRKARLASEFKKTYGLTISDYLIQTRMETARSLLLDSEKPLKEIADLTGYGTARSFFRAFKRFYQYTPGSLRKNLSK